jgi:hypothetical protein
VFAALTVTPGNGMFPDFTVPLISPKGAAALVFAGEEEAAGTLCEADEEAEEFADVSAPACGCCPDRQILVITSIIPMKQFR